MEQKISWSFKFLLRPFYFASYWNGMCKHFICSSFAVVLFLRRRKIICYCHLFGNEEKRSQRLPRDLFSLQLLGIMWLYNFSLAALIHVIFIPFPGAAVIVECIENFHFTMFSCFDIVRLFLFLELFAPSVSNTRKTRNHVSSKIIPSEWMLNIGKLLFLVFSFILASTKKSRTDRRRPNCCRLCLTRIQHRWLLLLSKRTCVVWFLLFCFG